MIVLAGSNSFIAKTVYQITTEDLCDAGGLEIGGPCEGFPVAGPFSGKSETPLSRRMLFPAIQMLGLFRQALHISLPSNTPTHIPALIVPAIHQAPAALSPCRRSQHKHGPDAISSVASLSKASTLAETRRWLPGTSASARKPSPNTCALCRNPGPVSAHSGNWQSLHRNGQRSIAPMTLQRA